MRPFHHSNARTDSGRQSSPQMGKGKGKHHNNGKNGKGKGNDYSNSSQHQSPRSAGNPGRGNGRRGGGQSKQQRHHPAGSPVVPPLVDDDSGPRIGRVPVSPLAAPTEQFVINPDGTRHSLYFPLELTNLDYLRRILDVCGSGLSPWVKERAPQIVKDLLARGIYNADLDELGGEDTYHLLKHVKNHYDEYASYMGVAGKALRPAVEWMSEQRNAWAH